MVGHPCPTLPLLLVLHQSRISDGQGLIKMYLFIYCLIYMSKDDCPLLGLYKSCSLQLVAVNGRNMNIYTTTKQSMHFTITKELNDNKH